MWNAAEESIKRREQIALDVSIPAITELRYAGRRIVDAIDLMQNGGSAEQVRAVLEDVRFCCHRARHDSIDAALAKIGIDPDDMTTRLGVAEVAAAYPDFHALYVELTVCKPLATSYAARHRREIVSARVLIAVAIATMILAALAVDWHKLLGS